jgi:indole-3-acetate monooxygenase
MSATATGRAAELLAAVRDLSPSITARAAEIDAARRIPADLHEQFRDTGLYRMLVPASHGGDEIGLQATLPVIEELARADASVGWTEGIGLQTPAVLGLLPQVAFDEIYERYGPDVTLGGAIAPVGRAHVADGGYRLDPGIRWPFASGCHNWDLLFGNCIVHQDGKPVMDPRGNGPLMRCMVFEQRHATILDTWSTLGLRGSGSNHFTLDRELFVPAEYACVSMLEPDAVVSVPGLFRFPLVEFTFHITATLIGFGQGTLDDFATLAATRARKKSAKRLAELPVVQHRLGEAQGALSAARDALYHRAGRLLRGELGQDYLSLVVPSWAENARVADLVCDIAHTCFRMYGADGIWDGDPLQRRLRDAFTIAQHASANEQSITRAGAAQLGQPVGLDYA